MDYIVCECRDETIHLFSLQTGIKVWVRRSLITREYGFRNANVSGAYHQIGHFLSFYHSVIFHPNGRSVLPGTLRYVFTLSGEKEDLFPESDCTFSKCVVRSPVDKNVIITHCPTQPKRINFWDMENGRNLLSIDYGKDIFSFAVSDDGSLIAVSVMDDYDTITILNLKENSRLNIISSGEQGACGFLRFTSDQNTLVYGFQYSACPDEASCLYCESAYNGIPGFNFITPLKNIHLPGKKNLEEAEFTPFVL